MSPSRPARRRDDRAAVLPGAATSLTRAEASRRTAGAIRAPDGQGAQTFAMRVVEPASAERPEDHDLARRRRRSPRSIASSVSDSSLSASTRLDRDARSASSSRSAALDRIAVADPAVDRAGRGRAAWRAPPSAATTTDDAVGPAGPGRVERRRGPPRRRRRGRLPDGHASRARRILRAAHALAGRRPREPVDPGDDRRRDLGGPGGPQLVGIAQDRRDADRADADGAGHRACRSARRRRRRPRRGRSARPSSSRACRSGAGSGLCTARSSPNTRTGSSSPRPVRSSCGSTIARSPAVTMPRRRAGVARAVRAPRRRRRTRSHPRRPWRTSSCHSSFASSRRSPGRPAAGTSAASRGRNCGDRGPRRTAGRTRAITAALARWNAPSESTSVPSQSNRIACIGRCDATRRRPGRAGRRC